MPRLSLERLARNQILFREVNERLLEVVDSWPVDFLCECSAEDCTETIALDRHEYESVRSRPTFFVITPGHELLEIERIVDEKGGFTVVEKVVATGVAAAHDPRSRADAR